MLHLSFFIIIIFFCYLIFAEALSEFFWKTCIPSSALSLLVQTFYIFFYNKYHFYNYSY